MGFGVTELFLLLYTFSFCGLVRVLLLAVVLLCVLQVTCDLWFCLIVRFLYLGYCSLLLVFAVYDFVDCGGRVYGLLVVCLLCWCLLILIVAHVLIDLLRLFVPGGLLLPCLVFWLLVVTDDA